MCRSTLEQSTPSGPIRAAKAYEMKETVMSKKGVGFIAANGSGIKNFGEEKIVAYTESGVGFGMKSQCAEVEKVLGSVHKITWEEM